jgi:hypothetical protein
MFAPDFTLIELEPALRAVADRLRGRLVRLRRHVEEEEVV